MSTETEFTPGPWREHEGFIVGTFSDGIVHDICDPRCAPVELMEELDANTRLIMSAPELLEACKMALVQIQQDNDERKAEHRGTEWQLKAAITKATGTI